MGYYKIPLGNGNYQDVYEPDPISSGTGGSGNASTPSSGSSASSPTPPVSSGSSDAQKKAEAQFKKQEFVLEGTANMIPSIQIESRQVRTFRGLGTQLTGNYFINTVRRTWSRSGFTQELEVLRNGVGENMMEIIAPPTPVEQNTVRPTPPQVTPQDTAKYYTVQSGDCLWNIAKRFYGDGSQYTKIVSANSIQNPNLIYPGTKLLIP